MKRLRLALQGPMMASTAQSGHTLKAFIENFRGGVFAICSLCSSDERTFAAV